QVQCATALVLRIFDRTVSADDFHPYGRNCLLRCRERLSDQFFAEKLQHEVFCGAVSIQEDVLDVVAARDLFRAGLKIKRRHYVSCFSAERLNLISEQSYMSL